jgi:hypothetical protein
MNLKTLSMMGALLLLAGTGANAQKKKEVLNDSNTPLHLLQPAYKVPYGMLTTEEIKADMDRVLRYLERILRLVSLIRIQVRLLRIMPI